LKDNLEHSFSLKLLGNIYTSLEWYTNGKKQLQSASINRWLCSVDGAEILGNIS